MLKKIKYFAKVFAATFAFEIFLSAGTSFVISGLVLVWKNGFRWFKKFIANLD